MHNLFPGFSLYCWLGHVKHPRTHSTFISRTPNRQLSTCSFISNPAITAENSSWRNTVGVNNVYFFSPIKSRPRIKTVVHNYHYTFKDVHVQTLLYFFFLCPVFSPPFRALCDLEQKISTNRTSAQLLPSCVKMWIVWRWPQGINKVKYPRACSPSFLSRALFLQYPYSVRSLIDSVGISIYCAYWP